MFLLESLVILIYYLRKEYKDLHMLTFHTRARERWTVHRRQVQEHCYQSAGECLRDPITVLFLNTPH